MADAVQVQANRAKHVSDILYCTVCILIFSIVYSLEEFYFVIVYASVEIIRFVT